MSLHTPLTEETRGMIGAKALEAIKPGAFIINTARGPICDTSALLAGLESGRLAGVGLDVMPIEPVAANDPLLIASRDPNHVAHMRCIFTPHSAFYSAESFNEMREKGAKEVLRALTDQPLRNRVN